MKSKGGSSTQVHKIPSFSDNAIAKRKIEIVFSKGISGAFKITPVTPFVLVSSDLADKIEHDV